MYSVGPHDRVEELKDVPQPDVGAPLPVVLADEIQVRLTYLVSDPDPDWDGTYVNVVSSGSDGTVAIVSFQRPSIHMLGPPNDEAFDGHPLAQRGLRPYSVFEVHRSSWLDLLVKMNRVHPYHSDALFANLRHFIFAFHDSTFECLAEDFSVSLFRGSINSAIQQMANSLNDS